MPFAPHEIEQKTFVVALRGYQTDEVDAFLRAVAADYRAALEQASGEAASAETLSQLQRLMQNTREDAEREAVELRAAVEAAATELRAAAQAEAAEIRASAQADASQIRAAATAQANVAELRAAAEAEAEEIRARAERDAAEIRDAAFREAEAAYAEIARQADELRRLEASLWSRMHALEHTVVECRQALSHVSNLHPMQPAGNGHPLSTNTLPSVEELLYRVEESVALDTNAEAATAAL